MPPSVFFEFSQSWSDQVPLILYSFFLHLLPYCIKPCSSWCSTSTSRLMLHNNSWHSVLFHSSKLSILHLVKISRPIFHSIHYIPFFCFSFLYRNCILKSKTKQQQKKIRFVSRIYFFYCFSYPPWLFVYFLFVKTGNTEFVKIFLAT